VRADTYYPTSFDIALRRSNVDGTIKYTAVAALASASLAAGPVVASASVAALSAGWLTITLKQNL
jgi:hypothetical protein